MQTNLSVLALTKQEQTYGGHSGYYQQLFAALKREELEIQCVTPSSSFVGRCFGKIFSIITGKFLRNQAASCAECEFWLRQKFNPQAACHIANVEEHLHLLRWLGKRQKRLIGTLHFPPSLWQNEDIADLSNLTCVVTLCERDRQFFATKLGESRVVKILHGVDSIFFHPDDSQRSPTPRLLFVGKWLRDFDLAEKVFRSALARWPDLEIDLVVSEQWIRDTSLASLIDHPRINWNESVSDAQLRSLYQRSWLLVLPLLDTSANNAVVEAMACGSIPVTHAVGGIMDYGGGDQYPLCFSNTPEAYMDLIQSYFSNSALLIQTAQNCVAFTKKHLQWESIARQHLDLYKSLT